MSTPEQLPESVRRLLRCTPPHDMACDLLALPLVGKPSRCDCGLASFLVEIEAAILAALTAARAEATEKEKERCARVCEKASADNHGPNNLGDPIREREAREDLRLARLIREIAA